MSAGSGGPAPMLVHIEPTAVADLRTALTIERATSASWEAIARSHGVQIEALKNALERYQKRSPN